MLTNFTTPNYVASSQYPEAGLAVKKKINHLYEDIDKSTINHITWIAPSFQSSHYPIIQCIFFPSLMNSSNDAPSILTNGGSDIANDIFLMNVMLNLHPNDGSTSVHLCHPWHQDISGMYLLPCSLLKSNTFDGMQKSLLGLITPTYYPLHFLTMMIKKKGLLN